MANDIARIVGRNIAAARVEKGIKTQRELAALLSKADPEMAPSNTRVSIWERGEEAPKQRYMSALVKVLDKSLDWFYTNHEAAEVLETPDLMEDLADEPSWLLRIEDKLDQVIRLLQEESGEDESAEDAEILGDVVAGLGDADESTQTTASDQPATPPAARPRKSA